ncbi:hypothetical protein IQ278_17005 [Tolypothrix sp. LEGE 11397]|nr:MULTISPECIES: hypothetical protein [unclassified Tolypothrix]EKF04863.1 hypothetical protein FDUTEX481_01023 [Tolypothrix sp. PCC 7601]MBE9083806.1 hypothetical protein [Tolypothrix sp. LEGE 11397]UYD30244.1 hypothetical protein HGR01_32335 [Tolypothrix sp. PCC 7712]UYD38088.1 hypothetical protein HG267_22190 [Tolypothrix sp. PCC 7601]
MREQGGQGDKEQLLLLITHYSLPITHYPLPITHYPLPITPCPMPHAPFSLCTIKAFIDAPLILDTKS